MTETLVVPEAAAGAEARISARQVPDPDALLECLIAVARAHGRTLTREAALAGLPIDTVEGLTPSLFARAAKRAGLACRVVRQPLEAVNELLLPAVLLLKGDKACLLLGWKEDGAARIVLPELGEGEVELSREELNGRYLGHTLYARPEFKFDARTPEVGQIRGRHWFWGTLAENAALYRDVLLAALMINLFAIALPLFTMNVYDRVVPNNATDTLWMLALGVIIVLVADVVLRTMRGYFLDLAGSRVDVRLSAYIMERVLGLRLESRPLSAGSFAANLRSFETVRDFITSATVTAFVDVPFALIFLVVIAWIGWPMVLPVIVGALVVAAYALAVRHKMHELSESTYRAGALRNATLVESLVGLESIKALGAEGTMQRKWESSAAFLSRVGAQLRLLSATTVNTAVWVQQTVSVLVIVVGVYLIGQGELSLGGLIACSMLSSRALGPIGQVTGLLVQYHNASTALQSLDGILKQPVERPDDSNFVTRQHFTGALEFKDVSFTYPNQEMSALRNVSLRIAAGEHVAILGRVGSGKSTLQKLILGLYQPSEGAVLVDGIDLRQLDPAELRRHVGYVPQDPIMFYGTLRENLAISARHADDTQILRAAQVGGIADFVNAHPKGFDMLVGERGESLSGGQRQGVAIARAAIADPPILLLDEPTGSMDHSSEEEIKRQLSRFAVGKTMIVVTHRTSLLELVDRIIVVDGGKVVADGPKHQVVEALRQGRIGRAV
ncbi:type I secretion system permease/ATPase [Cognatazoarcus halotolerans]|uniref:type I secretion system permease/ATPase n=1 Tax=Cognatazoarcus halotolerans TaxID=2686016 RepID=UPI00135B3830|nr:type I secretion system permease/ATPase [Cognatazoarcus halotolerans]MBX3678637.1 type I secretion system permease/ATPase [Rhodocyclaceae bacterium]MCB1899336.1 type I secretion system permease/ATPase [Rhodocyclaceae bacterium]MCP5308576.1 type I secretion system permease/ATPase [Zoogloeaceae bacterium]